MSGLELNQSLKHKVHAHLEQQVFLHRSFVLDLNEIVVFRVRVHDCLTVLGWRIIFLFVGTELKCGLEDDFDKEDLKLLSQRQLCFQYDAQEVGKKLLGLVPDHDFVLLSANAEDFHEGVLYF